MALGWDLVDSEAGLEESEIAECTALLSLART